MSDREDGLTMNSLYMIKLFSDQEEFYKIGISSAEDKNILWAKRLSKIIVQTGYNIEILHFVNCDGHPKLEDFESSIISILEDYKYEPRIPFKGQTECFIDNPVSLIKCHALEIFQSFSVEIKKSIQDLQLKDDCRDVDIQIIRTNFSSEIKLFEHFNELIQVLRISDYGITNLPLNRLKTEIKKSIFTKIRKIEYSIKESIRETVKNHENKLGEKKKILIKLQNRTCTWKDYYSQFPEISAYLKPTNSNLNELFSEEKRLELINEMLKNIEVMESNDQKEKINKLIDAYQDELRNLKIYENQLDELLKSK